MAPLPGGVGTTRWAAHGDERSPLTWNVALDFAVTAVKPVRRAILDQMMQETIRILQQLDLTLQPAQPHQATVDGVNLSPQSTSASPVSPPSSTPSSGTSLASLYGGELSSQVQPSVAKDYQLFLNLVEFLHRFFLPPFPSASQLVDSTSADYSSYIAALPSWVPRHTTDCLRALSL